MANRIPEIDAYIAKSAEFARPILTKLREFFHKACPQIEEVLKWSHPAFEYKGLVGGMAAFKHHCTFGFWKQSLLKDPHGLFRDDTMWGGKLTSLAELPSDKILIAYIREAIALNEKGVKAPMTKKRKAELVIPKYFMAALKKNKKTLATFEAFPPSHKREYVEWVTDAKQEATREKRLATTIEWLAQGKSRNWKYEKC